MTCLGCRGWLGGEGAGGLDLDAAATQLEAVASSQQSGDLIRSEDGDGGGRWIELAGARVRARRTSVHAFLLLFGIPPRCHRCRSAGCLLPPPSVSDSVSLFDRLCLLPPTMQTFSFSRHNSSSLFLCFLVFLLISPPTLPPCPLNQSPFPLVLSLSATPFLLFFSAPPSHFYTPSISPPPAVSRSHFVSESLDCTASPWDVSAISRSLISQLGSWQGSAARRGARAHRPTSINETSHAPAASVTRPLQRGAFSRRQQPNSCRVRRLQPGGRGKVTP